MDNFITSADQWDSSKHSNFTADEFKCQGSGKLKISSVVLDFSFLSALPASSNDAQEYKKINMQL